MRKFYATGNWISERLGLLASLINKMTTQG